MKQFCVLLLAIIQTVIANTVQLQKELTIKIPPGAIDCFYEKAKTNQLIDIEYQVIDGGHGDLDINFELHNPNDYPLVTEYKKSDNIHRITAHSDGDYKYCFDNSFSTFNSKTVFFEIIIESEGDEAPTDEWGRDVLDHVSSDQLVDIKVHTTY